MIDLLHTIYVNKLGRVNLKKMQLLSHAHLYPCTNSTLFEEILKLPTYRFFLCFSIMERIRKGSGLPQKSGGH